MRLDSALPAAYSECMRRPWARVRAQAAAATGAARSHASRKPWSIDRLTTPLTSEWLTRKKALMPTTQTTASAGWNGRGSPGRSTAPNSFQRCSRPTSPEVTRAGAVTASTYWGTLNSRLTGCGSNSSWLTAIPTPVASTSTGVPRNTTPSTITMSHRPIAKRWLRMGTRTTKRSATTRPAAYSSGGHSWAQPPHRWWTALGRYSATTTVAAAATPSTNSQAARGSDARTPAPSATESLTAPPPGRSRPARRGASAVPGQASGPAQVVERLSHPGLAQVVDRVGRAQVVEASLEEFARIALRPSRSCMLIGVLPCAPALGRSGATHRRWVSRGCDSARVAAVRAMLPRDQKRLLIGAVRRLALLVLARPAFGSGCFRLHARFILPEIPDSEPSGGRRERLRLQRIPDARRARTAHSPPAPAAS